VNRPEQARDSIVRNAAFAVGVKLVGSVFTAVLTIFLVRYLGPAEYGVFALAMSVGGLVLIPSDLGISHSAARFIAERRGKPDEVAAVVSDAVRLKLVISGAFSLALIASAGAVANAYDTPELAWPLRILAIATFGQSLMLLWASVFEALGRLSVYLRVVTAESALEAGASIVIVLFGTAATGAMAGRAAAYAFAAGFGAVLVARTISRRVRPRRGGHGHGRQIATYGSALVIVDGAFTIFSQIDVLLIGALLSISAVGLFEAAFKLAGFLGFIGLPVRSAVAPRLARDEGGPNIEALQRALRYLLLFQGVILAPMIVWAEPLTRIVLGSEYLGAADTLRAFAPFAMLGAISPLLAGAVNYLGAARRRVPIAIAALLINAAIDVALLKEIGIIAGAIGTDVAYTLYVCAHLWLLRQLIGMPLMPLMAPVLGSLVAAAAMALVLLPFGTDADVSVPVVVLVGSLASGVYFAVLVLTRQVSRAELRALGRRLRSLRGERSTPPG
jgi:O-antigen/teichoic acid export membrane protein